MPAPLPTLTLAEAERCLRDALAAQRRAEVAALEAAARVDRLAMLCRDWHAAVARLQS